MTSQSGFTLVEALVAGVISLLIPAVLITALSVSNRETGKGSSAMRLSQMADAVSEDIHRAGLSASWVFDYADAVAGEKCPAGPPVDKDGITGIIFCDANHDIRKGYKVEPIKDGSGRGILEEYARGKNPVWVPVVFAGDQVKLTMDPDGYNEFKSKGLFGIDANAGFTWFNFRYDMDVNGTHIILPLQTQSVVCRNVPERINTW
jgi:hypothetical protein